MPSAEQLREAENKSAGSVANGRGGRPLPGRIGGYRVLRLVGDGAMGAVYACRDESLGREVAIKVLHDRVLREPGTRERFLREARAMAQVTSPHVVTVFQVGEEAQRPFVVMQLLDGKDLAQRDGPLGFLDAVTFTQHAARGLSAAHEAGLVHRDVKPANLVLSRGQVKLTDFGLARPVDGSADLTQAGLVVGTPHYIAPEAARGAEATFQSDMYSLGATLFEFLADRPPYEGDAPMDVVSQHLTSSVPDIALFRPQTPTSIRTLLEKLLAKAPEARFATYEELIARLSEIRDDPTLPGAEGGAPPQVSAKSTSDGLENHFFEPPTTGTGTSRSQPRLSGSFSSVRTANLTVMFTDIAGYTERTAHQSREEADHWLELHDLLLPPVIRAFKGKLVKTIGDAFLATFESPTDAVLCGVAIQDRLHIYNQEAPSKEQITVRVTLSAGEVRLRKGDVFGEAVNLASRLLDRAAPGEVVFSDAVYATMNTAEVEIDSRGSHGLKGIHRQVGVFAAHPTPDDDGLPFGGHALSLLPRSLLRARVRPRVTTKVVRVAERVLPGPAKVAAALGVLVVLAAIAAGVLWLGQPRADDRITRIDEGDAPAVLRELAAMSDVDHTPLDLLIMGHARFASSDKKRAMEAYADARGRGGELDARAIDAAFAMLEGEDPGDAVVVLGLARDPDVTTRARALTTDAGWWPRHHAVGVLERRKELVDADSERVGLRDLLEATTCERRRFGVAMLERTGKSTETLAALTAAAAQSEGNKCMKKRLARTIAAVAERQ